MDETVQRSLIQHLESWRQAGLTHLPRNPHAAVAPPRPAAPALLAVEASSKRPPAPVSPESSVPMPPPRRAAAPADKPAVPPQISPAAVQALPTVSLSREERGAALAKLAKCVAGCTRCPELAATRKQTVFGVGDPAARVMFLGEAPGADEDASGEPFVGRAGQLLNKIIEAAKLKREELYICNILRCRPPGNRLPSPEEAGNCREWLDGQIAIVDPDYIVCWGSCAAQNLLGTTESIGKLRSRFMQHGRARVLCTYHPSYLLRNPAAKKPVWEDMQLLMAELGIPLT